MAQYLSPGVYVEEFDSLGQPIQGVSTSTAGFVGVAQKGPITGAPVLVTSMNDFNRSFGTYMPDTFGDGRFLAYAVEQFFANGGSLAYVVRVAPDGATSSAVTNTALGTISASNPGEWGNQITVTVTPSSKAKTVVTGQVTAATGNVYNVKSASGFDAGDIIHTTNGSTDFYTTVVSVVGNVITTKDALPANVIPTATSTAPTPFINTCEFNLLVSDGGSPAVTESYSNCSLNPLSSNYVQKMLTDSNLITITTPAAPPVQAAAAPTAPTAPVVAPATPAPAATTDSTTDADKDADTAGTNPAPNAPQAPPAAPVAPATAATTAIVPPFTQISGLPETANNLPNSYVVTGFTGGTSGDSDSVADQTSTSFNPTIFIGNPGDPPGQRHGIQAFLDNTEVSLMAVPGITNPSVQLALINHCELLANRFAVLDVPQSYVTTTAVMGQRNYFDSEYAAMYHPWLQVLDNATGRNIYIPPSGSVLGIYARTDNNRGVYKAPANEVIANCTGLSVQYGTGEQDILNPAGVNLIRSFPGQGIRVWGARTVSSNTLWKYVNVRRLFIYLEQSVQSATNWVVFEPNGPQLWGQVQRTLEAFLTTVYNSGALMGSKPSDAFFVNIGPSTMTQDDLDNGRLICEIGVAPIKPAEFVIFRFTQTTASSS